MHLIDNKFISFIFRTFLIRVIVKIYHCLQIFYLQSTLSFEDFLTVTPESEQQMGKRSRDIRRSKDIKMGGGRFSWKYRGQLTREGFNSVDIVGNFSNIER